MRLAVVLVAFWSWFLAWPASVAEAASFKISTGKFQDSAAIARVMKEVYRRLGHDFELLVRPAKRSLVEANSGRSDADLARVIGANSEYPNLVRVREPIVALSFSAIVAADSKQWLSSWDEVAKHRIGYPRGYRILDVRTQAFKSIRAIQAGGATAVAKMVKGGRIDVGIMITADANRLATELGGLTVLTPPMETVTLYHYLNVRHRRLAPAMEKVLIDLHDSGKAKEIFYQKQP